MKKPKSEEVFVKNPERNSAASKPTKYIPEHKRLNVTPIIQGENSEYIEDIDTKDENSNISHDMNYTDITPGECVLMLHDNVILIDGQDSCKKKIMDILSGKDPEFVTKPSLQEFVLLKRLETKVDLVIS
jgi:hypothetical protein